MTSRVRAAAVKTAAEGSGGLPIVAERCIYMYIHLEKYSILVWGSRVGLMVIVCFAEVSAPR